MVILEIYIFLKGRQDKKLYFLKKFNFLNRTNKIIRNEYYLIIIPHPTCILLLSPTPTTKWTRLKTVLAEPIHSSFVLRET